MPRWLTCSTLSRSSRVPRLVRRWSRTSRLTPRTRVSWVGLLPAPRAGRISSRWRRRPPCVGRSTRTTTRWWLRSATWLTSAWPTQVRPASSSPGTLRPMRQAPRTWVPVRPPRVPCRRVPLLSPRLRVCSGSVVRWKVRVILSRGSGPTILSDSPVMP